MTSLEIVRPGPLATIQDLGRHGHGRFGVSPSGAMDPLALAVANAIVGNPIHTPALELTGAGAELRFLGGETVFALAGGDGLVLLDGAPTARLGAHHAPSGSVLRLATRGRLVRTTLAVAGGLAVPSVLGSASTDLEAGLGPARLAAGDRVSIGRAPEHLPSAPPHEARARFLATVYDRGDDVCELRFVASAELPAALGAAFSATTWVVSPRSNRTGYRLAALEAAPAELSGSGAMSLRASEPLAPGAIQLPPDGSPVLLLADRQTVGGYPLLGHLASADRPRAGQLWPGDRVRFRVVTLAEARAAANLQRAAFTALLGPQALP